MNAVATYTVEQLPLAPAASESAAILNVIERTGLIRPADLRAGSTENVLTHQPA
jgi:hypothetical protein